MSENVESREKLAKMSREHSRKNSTRSHFFNEYGVRENNMDYILQREREKNRL